MKESTYEVGDIVLIRGRITRKTEDATTKPVYKLNLVGISIDIDVHETSIAGTTTDIPITKED